MNIFKRVIRIVTYVFLTFCLVGLIFCAASSDKLDIVSYTFKTAKDLSSDFSCLVISDYHHRSLNFSNGNMIEILKKQDKVDCVFFTGDMIDSHTESLDDVKEIFKVAKSLADKGCFYITGNHEQYAPKWNELKTFIENDPDITYLENNSSRVGIIKIYGIDDAKFLTDPNASFKKREEAIKKRLEEMTSDFDEGYYNVLLAHRPENFKMIAKDFKFDLMISGHTHGGQFRLGNWVPSKIALEESDFIGGKYHRNNTDLVVSRGLGYSAMFPLRVNCNPEIVKITVSK